MKNETIGYDHENNYPVSREKKFFFVQSKILIA